jgi:hypothetical protein
LGTSLYPKLRLNRHLPALITAQGVPWGQWGAKNTDPHWEDAGQPAELICPSQGSAPYSSPISLGRRTQFDSGQMQHQLNCKLQRALGCMKIVKTWNLEASNVKQGPYRHGTPMSFSLNSGANCSQWFGGCGLVHPNEIWAGAVCLPPGVSILSL